MGYGEAKEQLFESAMEYFGTAFERRHDLQQRLDDVEDILQAGALTARTKAREVVDRAKQVCGLSRR